MRFEKFVCAGNEESWVCSRQPFAEEEGRVCRGRARCKTGGGELKTYIPHDDWCLVREHDEEDRLYVNEAHRLAASDLTVPASTIVTLARYGKDDEFRERSPHEESDAKKVNRRRFNGTLAEMNDKTFHDCEILPTFTKTITGEKYLFKDVMHDGARSLIFLSPTGLRLLGEADLWGLDATFTVPKGVMQKLVIVPLVPIIPASKKCVPMVAATIYMERRRASDYEAVLKPIKQALPANALNKEEVEAMVLPAPGETEEG